MLDDASLAVLSMAVTVAVLSRRAIADGDVLRRLVDHQDCPSFGALVDHLVGRGERDRARGLVGQLEIIRAAGGWPAALGAAHPHARETWASAAAIVRGEA